MARRKSYNPFKMWGSYLGFFGVPVLDLLLNVNGFGEISDVFEFVPEFVFLPFRIPLGESAYLTAITLGLAGVGFLIGWGIHALIRRFR